MSDSQIHLTRVAAARWRLAVLLTTAMTVIYVGFILLIAYNKPLLGTILMPASAWASCSACWSSSPHGS